MKISYHSDSNTLSLKVCFSDGKVGYSDYLSYKELGYPSVEEVLSSLSARNILIQNAFYDAYIFPNLPNKLYGILNHSLYYRKKLYSISKKTIKLKLSGDIDSDVIVFKDHQDFSSIRLDLNFQYTMSEFKSFLKRIDTDKVEYIEDPVPFNKRHYEELSKLIPIAIDHPFNILELEDSECFTYIFRPVIRSSYSQQYNAIYSNQMGSVLSSWHSFAYTLLNADKNVCHGSFNPVNEDCYHITNELVLFDTDRLIEEYHRLERLNWIGLKI